MALPQIRHIDIEERGVRFFPRADLIDPYGNSLILSDTRKIGAVELRDIADGFNLMVMGFIGVLPLTSSITLNITPKFPIQNLWKMLEVAEETYVNILTSVRKYESTQSPTPHLMLARSFCYYLQRLLSAGLERSYYRKNECGYYKPRIEFGQTISRYASRGNPIETVSSVFVFGLDNPINRIIKSACLCFSQLIPNNSFWKKEKQLITLALETLQFVKTVRSSNIDFNVNGLVSKRLAEHYSGLLKVYQLLMLGGGVSFVFDSKGKELPSFLFNLDSIFERFVRKTLSMGLNQFNMKILDGNLHLGYLFEDNHLYKTKSDIIFKSGNKIFGLGEVKYKPKLKEADRYQIISHTTAANSSIGILFTPAVGNQAQGPEYIGRLSSTKAKFYHYRVDIRDNIEEAQKQLNIEVYDLIKSQSTQ